MMQTLANLGAGIGSPISSSIFVVLKYFIELLCLPINSIINAQNIPGLDTFLSSIESFFDLVFDWFNYIRSAFLIDSFCIHILIYILIMKFVIKPAISGVKMFVKWWHAIH